MKASIIDLMYKTTNILKTLDRNESVAVLYHCKIKSIIKPARKKSTFKVKDHPFFAMYKDTEQSVIDQSEAQRKPRYDL